jgi:diacylglycerol kinase (ATP)
MAATVLASTKTYVVWNAKSSRASENRHIFQSLIESPNVTVLETTSPTEAVLAAKQAAEEGFDLVVAAGGDGNISSVANGLAQASRKAALGVLPLGTANDFAFSLGLPDDPELAYQLLASGQRRRLDLIEIWTENSSRFYVNVAAGGNSDRVTSSLTTDLKKTWGSLCYLRGALGILADLTSFQATVAFDDEPEFEIAIWNIIVANGRTNAGRLELAPYASLEDGLMDVILIRDGTVLDLASLASEFLLSNYLQSEQVLFRRAKSLLLKSNPPIYFSLDGETVDEPLTRFKVHPRALEVVVGDDYRVVWKEPEVPAE